MQQRERQIDIQTEITLTTTCSKEKDKSTYRLPSVDEMRKAEQTILKSLQEEAFPEEIKILNSLGVQNNDATREFAKGQVRCIDYNPS